jgi:hypothetical protein
MKKCFKCGEIKPLNSFYTHKQMADGHLNKCKECAKLDSFGRTLDEINKRKERDRNRSNAKERIKKNRERLLQNPEKYKKNCQQKNEWAKKNKHKRNAHCKVARALLHGVLIRPNKCEKCGEIKAIEAHHDDYAKPLEVKWLCIECHNERHKELREIERQNANFKQF